MKKRVRSLLAVILIILVVLVLLIFVEQTGYVVREYPKQVQFYFYDEITGCSLDGYIFIGDKLIGKTSEGIFNLTWDRYEKDFQDLNLNISVFGRLGDCFDDDLLFDKSWKNIQIDEYYFDEESLFNFKTKINPHNPVKRELIGFVKPDSVDLENINLVEDVFEDLSEINSYLNNKIEYVQDWEFNEENYWQTPAETLDLEQGDCEDFSTALLSLFLAYGPSLNCYNVVLTTHVTTLCYINDSYIYYDQERIELKKKILNHNREETKEKVRDLKEEYFEYYGINDSETRIHFAFDNNEYVEFWDDDDFLEWQYSLIHKDEKINIFERLEEEFGGLEDSAAEPAEEELSTQAVELPTIKGFIEENLLMLLFFVAVILTLIWILVRLNQKVLVMG